MIELWEVADEQRRRWEYAPHQTVGPLAFGITADEVVDALHAIRNLDHSDRAQYGPTVSQPGCFAEFPDVGVTTYFAHGSLLAGVAIDALRGPQVTIDGVPLTGRTPSVLDKWIVDHTGTNDLDLRYTHEGNPASIALGLVMRVQRAGDLVLSRPLLLTPEWVEDCWDRLPDHEWRTF
ncbi:hypothetical protein [Actinocrispum wychmicini]|uniref:hypothetical protein n=1 Tax=Actinocrispum wychmicini TaxID=1213861 RepID=UPI001046C6A3|nr:hypothetical protein [Actinocrispum wychmicini]